MGAGGWASAVVLSLLCCVPWAVGVPVGSDVPPLSAWQDLPQPKRPDTSAIGKEFKAMENDFVQQTVDGEADKVQRASDYDAKRVTLNAQLSHATSLLLDRRALEGRCHSRASQFAAFEADLRDGVALSVQAKQERESQLSERLQKAEAVLKRSEEARERVAEIGNRLQREIDADPQARGRGTGFDAFVTHDDAVTRLAKGVNISQALLEKLATKIRHNTQAREAISPVLECPGCLQTSGVLAKHASQHPIDANAESEACGALEAEATLESLEQRVRVIKEKLESLALEEAIQIKLEAERAEKLGLEKESLRHLQRQTGQSDPSPPQQQRK